MIGITTLAAFVVGAGLTGIGAYALSQREEPELELSGPSAVGAGDTVTFTAEHGGEGAGRYEWYVGGERKKVGSNELTVTVNEEMDNAKVEVHAYNPLSVTHVGWDMKKMSVWSEE